MFGVLKNFHMFVCANVLLKCFSFFQEASAAISGVGVYGKLKFESGIHRVQVAVSRFYLSNLVLLVEIIDMLLFSEFL